MASDAPVALPRAAAVVWLAAALAAALVVPAALDATVPLLTIVWLVVAAVVLFRTGRPAALGLVVVPRRELAAVTLAASVAMTALFAAAELLFHPYRELLALIEDESRPDSTFAWVIRHGTGWGLVGFALYGALVTMFAEEVVFRGAVVQALHRRGAVWAVAVSTLAFTAVQALPAALLPASAALGFLLLDSILAVGIVGGLAAHRTRSIWPGLVAATVANVVILAAVG